MRPVPVEAIAWETWSEGERYGGRVRRLAPRGANVGVHIEELPPGRQSCPFHYHLHEEEHLLALSGEALLRLGGEVLRIRAGDYVCFPAGEPQGHCLVNDGTAPFQFLMIGENKPHDVCLYPDSSKINVRLARLNFRVADARDYYDGERSGESPLPLKET
ncbi:MAG: cupin domain-containing protein [Alphaproteobacteria bacterium]|nr:cupin domain-containing protein [Alphaproteobacteria bacterium]